MFKNFFAYISGTTNYSGAAIDKGGLWTFFLFVATLLLFIATIFLWLVGKKQIGGINKTTKADFIKKFSKEFFNENTRDLIMLFDNNAISFKVGEIEYGKDVPKKNFPYFFINEDIVKQLKIDQERLNKILLKKVYSAYEIDDYLLGIFENIGSFEKNGLIEIKDIYNAFDWYIEITWNNYEIQKYIKQQRAEEDRGNNIYEDFESIFNKCNSFLKPGII